MSTHTETPPAQPAPASAPKWRTAALLLGWALVVLLLFYFLELGPRMRTEAPSVDTIPTEQAGFPAPPVGAVVYARRMGGDALALGVVPQPGQVIVQASVVGPRGEGVSGLDVTFGAQGATAEGRSCGAGCYRAALATAGKLPAVDVVVEGDTTTRWSVPLPEAWPPQSASGVVDRAERVWRSLDSLSFEETLQSDETHVVASSWQLQAPNRLAYQIVKGATAVVMGERRWDRVPGKPWKASPQLPIRQPTPPWVDARNANVVGSTVVNGRPALVVTFFDPKTPGWYTATVDRDSLRTYDVRMVATAHFMHDRFHSFDRTSPIRPPVRR